MDNYSFGQCRCCQELGRHRDIMKAYYFEGKREIYYEMFIECFNLYLSTDAKASSLLCGNCVQQLRDASAFKCKVSVAEHNIINSLNESLVSTENGNTIFVNVSESVSQESKRDHPVKPELDIKVELEDDYDGIVGVDLDDCSESLLLEDSTNDLYIKGDLVPGEAELLARFKPGTVKPLPTRNSLYSICPNFAAHMDELRGKYITPEMIKKLLSTKSQSTSKRSFVSEKQALSANALVILTYSNVTPFRSKKRKGFPCFYCYSHFEDVESMRNHQRTHKKTEAKAVLRHMTVETMSIYVDVTDLKCTICDTSIPNLNELKSHLSKTHNKKMFLEQYDCVIPFKLGKQFMCQICNGNFETFGSIERHMNVHFRNFVCNSCGGGFITKHRLKVHIKSMHADGYFPCILCHKAFASQQKMTNHVNSVHKCVQRFKCKRCPQRFKEYFKRQRHMVEVHGEAPVSYTCNVCDRSFERRYTLSRHMKRDHLDERDYQCDVCAYTCFSGAELRVHMIKHNGERIHECSVCKKSYARMKTLKEHMRIHNNDRRFSCAVCGQAFVQKCSLKGHIKTHHLEYSIEHNV